MPPDAGAAYVLGAPPGLFTARVMVSVAPTAFPLLSFSSTVMNDPALPPALMTGVGAAPKASSDAFALAFPLVSAKVATTPKLELDEAAAWATDSPRVLTGVAVLAKTPPPEITTVPVTAPAVAGGTVVFKVQLAPLANTVPQLSASLYSPLARISRSVIACAVLLLSVAMCAVEVTLLGCTPKSITGGVRINPAGPPSPASETVCEPPPALSVIVSVPVRWPSAVGTNLTVSVQVAPTATAEPQLPDSEKSP